VVNETFYSSDESWRYMGLDNFKEPKNPSEYEQKIHDKIRQHGYNPRKIDKEGMSGNKWEVDAWVQADDGSPVAYFEIKNTSSEGTAKSSYTTQMKRAVAQVIDFRGRDIPGCVLVPQKRDFGNRNWDALFESINCSFIEENELPEFLSELD
jgi:hypothetical protein